MFQVYRNKWYNKGSENMFICFTSNSFSRKYELVDKLLDVAKQFFKIGLVLFDKGLSKDSKILNTVERHNLKCLAPMEKNDRIKRIANFGDAENNFTIKTKTANFTMRYFFFLFMSLLCNLKYFVRLFYPIIAERWKDLIEDEMRRESKMERSLRNYVIYYSAMKNLLASFISATGLSFVFYFIEKT